MASSDKSMSSRLLTMKFMQRGVANSPNASPSHQRASKRQRTSFDRTSKSFAPRHSDADIEAMQAAIADEEAKRVEIVERLAAEQGDTRWVLSVRAPVTQDNTNEMRVSTAGFADIDEGSGDDEEVDEDEEENSGGAVIENGRMKFGKFATAAVDEEDKNDEDLEEDYDPSDLDKLIANASRQAAPPPPTYTNGRMPTSISGGGASRASNTPKKDFNCYKCGQSGHMARNCTG